MQKTLVIFDVDDTLLNSMRLDSNAFKATFESMYNAPLKTIDWSKYPHVTDTSIFNTAYELVHGVLPNTVEVDRFRTAFVELIRHNRAISPESFFQIPGALDLFNLLRSEEAYEVGLATGGWMAPARLKLHHMGFDLVGVYDAYADGHTSREEILTTALSKAEADHGSLRPIYIGDAIWDVNTTRNLNMDFVGIRHRGDTEVLEDQGATQVIVDYQNVQGFLQIVDQATPPRQK